MSNPYPRSFVLSWPEPQTVGFCLAPACTPSLLGVADTVCVSGLVPRFSSSTGEVLGRGGAGPVADGSRADARAPAGRRPGGPVVRGVSGTSAAWVVPAPLLRSLHAAPPRVRGPWQRLRNSALSRPSPASSAGRPAPVFPATSGTSYPGCQQRGLVAAGTRGSGRRGLLLGIGRSCPLSLSPCP